jgi:predicted TIM-barrel fold metal-dependent hydrolase
MDAARRALLARLAAAGAASLVGAATARADDARDGTSMKAGGAVRDAAATPGAAGPSMQRIDVHHHLLPPKYIEEVAAMRTGERAPPWTAQNSIDEMDRSGIASAIVSLTQPGVWFGDAAQARRLARLGNEYAAGMARDFPRRFGSFAALPLPDTEGSLHEIEYALDSLKASGIGLMTSYRDKWLGDRSFWPVLEELNRRKAVVYTHPLGADCCKSLADDVGASTIEYATDTTRTMASIVFSGAAARFPDIRWIFSHGGGTAPFLVSRFQRAEAALKDRAERLPNGVMHELKKFYYDTAQANHAGALAALTALVAPPQILFGTDFPFRPGAEAVSGLAAYGFKPDELRAIEHGNAERLLSQGGA